jgi:hypothetical protein
MIKIIPCEIWTRCVGYYRPVNQMNKGKQEEVSQRKMMPTSAIKEIIEAHNGSQK